jgi:hypothetical protein
MRVETRCEDSRALMSQRLLSPSNCGPGCAVSRRAPRHPPHVPSSNQMPACSCAFKCRGRAVRRQRDRQSGSPAPAPAATGCARAPGTDHTRHGGHGQSATRARRSSQLDSQLTPSALPVGPKLRAPSASPRRTSSEESPQFEVRNCRAHGGRVPVAGRPGCARCQRSSSHVSTQVDRNRFSDDCEKEFRYRTRHQVVHTYK